MSKHALWVFIFVIVLFSSINVTSATYLDDNSTDSLSYLAGDCPISVSDS